MCSKSFMTLAVAALAAVGNASAAPVLVGPGGSAQVGQTVVYTVVDNDPAGGHDAVLGAYLADFEFSYDSAVLKYFDAAPAQTLDAFTAPPAGSDPAGSFLAQAVLLDPSVLASGAVFTVSFTALAASTGTQVSLSQPLTGMYGTHDAGATPFVLTTSTMPISAVPEPASWALLLVGGLLLPAVARRGQGRLAR